MSSTNTQPIYRGPLISELEQAVRSGSLLPGMNVLMTGFGAGLTWGSAVVRWS